MKNLTKSTKSLSAKEIARDWHLIDVNGKILGRISPEIARFLQGKHKLHYVPYLDGGDYVVVINAKKVKITGKKKKSKIYTHYSGYPGGLKHYSLGELLENKPIEVIKRAVSGMLPKNKLRNKRLSRLFIFPDEKYPYEEKFRNLKQG